MIAKKFYLGIDSGGTKLELMFADTNLKKISEHTFKGFHYSLNGPDKTSEKLSEYILEALKKKKLSLKNCEGICFGIAGARENADRNRLKKKFVDRLKFKNIIVTTDAMNAVYGALNGEDGMILISGTGSVLYGKYNNKFHRVGGWGRILGDQGSGYWLGHNALRMVTPEYDFPGVNKSMLLKAIEKDHCINKENIVDYTFNGKVEIQKIAETVIRCAEKKDRNALSLTELAADGLFYHIHTYLKISKIKNYINIAFIGSIVENKNPVSSRLILRIRKELKNVRIISKNNSSTYGAILLCRKNFTKL
ncbi:N-acetylglucosamine kinase [soil metagenome]